MRKILKFKNGQTIVTSNLDIAINGEDPIQVVEITEEQEKAIIKDKKIIDKLTK